MMEIELERYQNKFHTAEKQKAKNELSLAQTELNLVQTESIIDVSKEMLGDASSGAYEASKRVVNASFGARGAYIAEALSTVEIH